MGQRTRRPSVVRSSAQASKSCLDEGAGLQINAMESLRNSRCEGPSRVQDQLHRLGADRMWSAADVSRPQAGLICSRRPSGAGAPGKKASAASGASRRSGSEVRQPDAARRRLQLEGHAHHPALQPGAAVAPRRPRPKSAEPFGCATRAAQAMQLARQPSAPQTTPKSLALMGADNEADLDKIAGDQWIQSLERRIERVAKLEPGSLHDALLLARPADPDAAEPPARQSRPTSAVARAARPTSAVRTGRPQSATSAVGVKGRVFQQIQQVQPQLRVVGAQRQGPQRAHCHQARQRKAPERRQLVEERQQMDEEWTRLGVADVGGDSDSEEEEEETAPADVPLGAQLAAWGGEDSLFRCGPRQRHQVSPASSCRSLSST